jgi:aminopeptidase
MPDARIAKLAKVLVRYSLDVKKGHWVRIAAPALAGDLIAAVHAEVLACGGHPNIQAVLPGIRHHFLKHATKEQLEFLSPAEKVAFRKVDKVLNILGDWNSKEMTHVDPRALATLQLARKPVFDMLLRRVSTGAMGLCITQFPCHSSAQDAEMALAEYEDFIFGAALLDKRDPVAAWRDLSRRQAGIIKQLSRLKTIRIVGRDTDLAFRVEGRTWVNCDGHINFPDGEIFTGPWENSAEGHIRYTFPAVYAGREVSDIRLVFKKGKVVEAHAAKGEEILHKQLDVDPGARRVGELAFGTNPAVKTFTRNTLFDEKIGGTMHIALGASLPQSGAKNRSAIHWDMVCDTRRGFTIYGDGKPIHKNGKFLIK